MKKIFTLSFPLFVISFVNQSWAQPCSDLFISEYIEGSSFNKVIEIFNPTTGTVQLDGYQLLLFSNGAPQDSPSFKFNLHGSLLSNDVYVIAHPDADSVNILPIADTTNLVCNWNGDDAVALINTVTADTLDVIGVIGQDPGTEWNVSGGTTKDHTLVRSDDVQEGTSDWSQSATEWFAFSQDDFSSLGYHEMNPCSVTTPVLILSADSTTVPENVGSFNLKVSILNPNANPTSVDVSATGGTATAGDDYSFTSQTITFPASSSTPILLNVAVVNDGISEADESIVFSLQNPTNGALLSASGATVQIIDDDGLYVEGNLDGADLKVFPNPVHDMLQIHSSAAIKELWIENLLGENLVDIIPDNPFKPTIPMDEFQSGIYLLKISMKGSFVTAKVLKQ